MKRLLIALGVVIATTATAATLVPVTLLNPAGSTSGQAIVSTGPTSAPAWATVSVSTVSGTLPVANGGTGAATGSAALTNLGAAATAGTLGQFAATTSAQLAGVLTDETGSGSAVFGTAPTITTPNIVGVTNGSNAAAGQVGEYITTNVPVGSAVPLTNITATNVASISLTAGDWDVWGVLQTNPQGSTVQSDAIAALSTTSASFAAPNLARLPFSVTGVPVGLPTPTIRLNVTSTTTVYLVAYSAFTAGTNSAYGYISARRRR